MSEASLVAAIARMQNEMDAMRRDLDRLPSRTANSHGFWALLTDASAIDGYDNRWKYSWKKIILTMPSAGVIAYEQPTDALVGPVTISGITGSTGYAYNLIEMDNTIDIAGSGWSDDDVVQTDDFAAQDSFRIEAINQIGMTQTNPSQTKYPIVWLRQLELKDSNHLAYGFCGWNTPQIYAAGS